MKFTPVAPAAIQHECDGAETVREVDAALPREVRDPPCEQPQEGGLDEVADLFERRHAAGK
jgi:hypothetical protein